MIVGKTFMFDASHHLVDYKGACEHVHGHTYRLDVEVEGEIKDDGMVLDFTELKKIVGKKVLTALDHQDLNEIIENPTAENIVEWIWSALKGDVNLNRVRLYEGDRKWVEKKK